jgi:pSer/pThr/pTyr-binding forkhead associated (FHA) protein
MPLSMADTFLLGCAGALVITLILLGIVAHQMRGQPRQRVVRTAVLMAGALALFLPGALLSIQPSLALGADFGSIEYWEYTTATFEAVATVINLGLLFGGLGSAMLIAGVSTCRDMLPTRWPALSLRRAAPAAPPAPATPARPNAAPPATPVAPLPPLHPLAQARATIRIIRPGGGDTRAHSIEHDIRIGRDAGQCTLVIDEPSVSAYHACISQREGAFFLEDMSRTGTYVDGAKIPVGLPFELHNAARISIGCALLHFSLLDSDQTDYPWMPPGHQAMLIYLNDDKQEGEESFVVPLIGEEIGLGRYQSVKFTSKRVSRHHADISYTNGAYYLTNRSDGGQTFINDKQVKEETLLRHGQIITLGDQYVLFELENEGSDDATDYTSIV